MSWYVCKKCTKVYEYTAVAEDNCLCFNGCDAGTLGPYVNQGIASAAAYEMVSPAKSNDLKESINKITDDVVIEIHRAINIHGALPDNVFHCLAIIMEELGEASQDAVKLDVIFEKMRKKATGYELKEDLKIVKYHVERYEKNLRKELIQVAAMAISTILHQEM